MSAQLRLASRMVCIVAFGLLVLMSGTKAHAQSVTLTTFSATGSPGGYNNVTDTVKVGIAFSNFTYAGGYGYGITVDVLYYSGPYLSGTLLQSTTTGVYSNSGNLPSGNSNVSATLYFNTPAMLRASEPAGTQSIHYIYHISGGGGFQGWSGGFSTYCMPDFIVHG